MNVWAYVTEHLAASAVGLIVGLVGGFCGGIIYAGFSKSTVERVRAISGVVIALLAIGTMIRVSVATGKQARCNEEFREGIAARSAAQQAFGEADERFTVADEEWVADQIRVLDAARNRSLTPAQKDHLTDQWRESLVVKLRSAQEKRTALEKLDQVRNDNPVEPAADC